MKKRTLSVLIAVIMMLGLTPFGRVLAAESTNFTDANFEAAVREAIGKPVGDIDKSDVENVTHLYVTGRGITSLAGIEHFTDLEVLMCGITQASGMTRFMRGM